MNVELKKEMQALHEEYTSDVNITEYNLHEMSMKVPALKAKWIRQLWTHKHELKTIQKDLEKLKHDQTVLVRNRLKVDATDSDINKLKVKFNKSIEVAEGRIEELEFIIEHLKMYEKSIQFHGNDVSHVIESTKLEH